MGLSASVDKFNIQSKRIIPIIDPEEIGGASIDANSKENINFNEEVQIDD